MDNAFINILSDHIQLKKTSVNLSCDWENIRKLSRSHEVTGIIQYQCKDFIPAEYAPVFKKAYATALFYYSNRVRAMKSISEILTAAGITFFPVKGLEVAKFYPCPALRTMGDNDIIVQPGELKNAVRALKEHGFNDAADSGEHVWSCDYRGMHFEVHDKLTDGDTQNSQQESFFENFMPFVKNNELDWNFHFLFLIMHLRKHFMLGGVGIRQFMDIALVAKGNKELDWDLIEKQLKMLKLKRFAHSCYSLIEYWFGIKIPVEYDIIDVSLADEVTAKILNDGVFGHEDESNKDNWVGNILIDSGGSLTKNRIRFFFRRIFPPYDEMTGYPGCRFLVNRRYLLPLAWIRRFVFMIKAGKSSQREHTFAGTFKSTSQIEKRRSLLDRLGLLDK
ncbi:MAG: nucleotidyltransferase family protein [Clostridiales bacterium]|nr:nucleotidyltransferase family protein [Clostridiales bacterium]